MIIRINGNPVTNDFENFFDHFHGNTIFQQIHDAPFGSGSDLFIMGGLVLTVGALTYLLVPPERKRLKIVVNIVTYLALGLVTLFVVYDQFLTAYNVVRTW